MSTISPKTTIQLHKNLKKKKSWLLDCPVSGGEIGAKKGKLSIMVGGKKRFSIKKKNYYKNSVIKLLILAKVVQGK
ncbi:MAG: hypothetical protein Ct9H90mP3_8820 [Flammeovirgaceae bacterium]|nr:MAG: hypothetical protein Ct9H90mP3_8820 [Flammeovirgaceae bacterium]